MAFTGTIVVTKVAGDLFRITGAILTAGVSGTIGFTIGTNDIEFTAPEWLPTTGVTLQAAINVVANRLTAGAATAVPLQIVKTGTTQTDFQITVTNPDGAASTGAMELYVQYKS